MVGFLSWKQFKKHFYLQLEDSRPCFNFTSSSFSHVGGEREFCQFRQFSVASGGWEDCWTGWVLRQYWISVYVSKEILSVLAAGCCWGICNPIWNVEIAGYWGIYWLSLPGYLSSIVRSQLMEILHLQMITKRSSHHNTQHTSKQFSDSIWHFIGWTILSVVILFTEDLQLPDAQSSWLLLP